MAGSLDNMYGHLPVALQNVAVSLYGWRWNKRRFGGIFEQELLAFQQREEFSAEQWRDYQTMELRRLLLHAFEKVPCYRRKYSAAGFQLHDFKKFELEDLRRLPFLEKDELRRFGKSDLLSTKLESGGKFFASSGSTGTPTSILFSHAFHQRWSAAFEARIRHWAGLNRDLPRGMIGGRRILQSADALPPFYRYNLFERQTYFSAYHIGPRTVEDYLRGMTKGKVEYMTGYAMANYFLAKEIEKAGLRAPKMRAVITSSEKLTQEMRDTFRRVYGCATYDSYSGVECCGLISETQDGFLVNSPDVGILEVVDSNGKQVSFGESGEVISTGLLNFEQPLIRYRIGDRVTLGAANKRPSNISMPVIGQIDGRIEDTIIGPDGRSMVRFHGIFVDLPDVIEAQIVQQRPDYFIIRVVTTGPVREETKVAVRSRMQSQLGNIEVNIQRVDSIARSDSGKFKAVVSLVK